MHVGSISFIFELIVRLPPTEVVSYSLTSLVTGYINLVYTPIIADIRRPNIPHSADCAA
jgi:hypothetical protein